MVNEAEVDIFLEFPCFLCDLVNVGNLISGSSAFSKLNLNIWNFLVYIMLKPSLEDFEHVCHCYYSNWHLAKKLLHKVKTVIYEGDG